MSTKQTKQPTVTISANTGELIVAASQSMTSTNKATTAAIDGMYGDGVRSHMLRKDTKVESVFDAVFSFVVKGLDDDAQRLILSESKGLSDTEKATKRVLRQEVGSRIGKFAKALERRENNKTNGAGSGPRLWSVRIREEVQALIDGLQKADAKEDDKLLDVDVVDAIQALEAVLDAI